MSSPDQAKQAGPRQVPQARAAPTRELAAPGLSLQHLYSSSSLYNILTYLQLFSIFFFFKDGQTELRAPRLGISLPQIHIFEVRSKCISVLNEWELTEFIKTRSV